MAQTKPYILYNDNTQYTLPALTLQSFQHYINTNGIYPYALSDNKITIPDLKFVKSTLKQKSSTENPKTFTYVSYDTETKVSKAVNNIIFFNEEKSSEPHIELSIKYNSSDDTEVKKQININSFELQLLKHICDVLNNKPSKLTDFIPRGLDNKFIKQYEFNKTKILFIPNVFNTLPYMMSDIYEISKSINYNEELKQYLTSDDKMKTLVDTIDIDYYQKILDNHENIISDEARNAISSVISKLQNNTPKLIDLTSRLMSEPMYECNYNIFVLESNDDNEWEPIAYNIHDLTEEYKDIINHITVNLLPEFYGSVLYPKSNVKQYHNYYTSISLVNIFNIAVTFFHPMHNMKLYNHKVLASISLSELLCINFDTLSEIEFPFDINDSYLNEEHKYKVYDTIEYVEQGQIGGKTNPTKIFKGYKILFFSKALWGDIDILMVNDAKTYRYVKLTSHIDMKGKNDPIVYYKIEKDLSFNAENKANIGDIYNILMKRNPYISYTLTDTNIYAELYKYYPLILNKLYRILVYINNKKLSNGTYSYDLSNDEFNAFLEQFNTNSELYYTFDDTNIQLLVSDNFYIFISKHKTYKIKGKQEYKHLAWVFRKTEIDPLDKEEDYIKFIKRDIAKSIISIYKLNVEELTEVYNSIISLFSNDKYFILLHNLSGIDTKHLHIQITNKNNYYWSTYNYLNIDFSHITYTYSIDKILSMLKQYSEYLSNYEKNLKIFTRLASIVNPLPITYKTTVQTGGNSSSFKDNNKTKKRKRINNNSICNNTKKISKIKVNINIRKEEKTKKKIQRK